MIMFKIQWTNIIKALSIHNVFHQVLIMAPWFHTNPVLGDSENPTIE